LNPGVRGQEKNWGFAETGDRAELIRRLDAIEGTLQRLAPLVEAVAWSRSERAQIGHNHPPEHIDVPPLSSVDVEMGTAAVNLVRIELNSEQPRSDILKVCGLVLRSISARVQAFVAWTAVKGDVFLDAALKEFGKRAVQGVISIVVLQEILQNLHLDLAAAINTIFHAFK